MTLDEIREHCGTGWDLHRGTAIATADESSVIAGCRVETFERNNRFGEVVECIRIDAPRDFKPSPGATECR